MKLENRITRFFSVSLILFQALNFGTAYAAKHKEQKKQEQKDQKKQQIVCDPDNWLNMLQGSKETEEEALSKKEKKLRKKAGHKARKSVHFKKLKKFLVCTSQLIESQFKGYESSLFGIGLLNELSERMKIGNFHHKDLYKKCKARREKYKEAGEPRSLLLAREKEIYFNAVAEAYPGNQNLLTIAKRAANPKLLCRKPFSVRSKVSLGGGVGGGFTYNKCVSPLGRSIHIPAISGSYGYGLGATVSFQAGSRRYFEVGYAKLKELREEKSSSTALVVGIEITKIKAPRNPEEITVIDRKKYEKKTVSVAIALGVGVQTMKSKSALVEFHGRSKFGQTGMFTLLNVPKEVLY